MIIDTGRKASRLYASRDEDFEHHTRSYIRAISKEIAASRARKSRALPLTAALPPGDGTTAVSTVASGARLLRRH